MIEHLFALWDNYSVADTDFLCEGRHGLQAFIEAFFQVAKSRGYCIERI